jgi:hypothetical protein
MYTATRHLSSPLGLGQWVVLAGARRRCCHCWVRIRAGRRAFRHPRSASVRNAPTTPPHFGLSPWETAVEPAPPAGTGEHISRNGCAGMRPVFSRPCRNLNREMVREAVVQVFQNAIAAVWIRTGLRLTPPAGSCSLNPAEDFDRAAARSVCLIGNDGHLKLS